MLTRLQLFRIIDEIIQVRPAFLFFFFFFFSFSAKSLRLKCRDAVVIVMPGLVVECLL